MPACSPTPTPARPRRWHTCTPARPHTPARASLPPRPPCGLGLTEVFFLVASLALSYLTSFICWWSLAVSLDFLGGDDKENAGIMGILKQFHLSVLLAVFLS